jgi:hypothetical protein
MLLRNKKPGPWCRQAGAPPWGPYLENFPLGWESAAYHQKLMRKIKSRQKPK